MSRQSELERRADSMRATVPGPQGSAVEALPNSTSSTRATGLCIVSHLLYSRRDECAILARG